MVLYLDEETDRIRAKSRRDFESAVEAARAGAIFSRGAAGQRSYERWKRSLPSVDGRSTGLVGAALEAAVMGLRRMHPDIVTVKV